jgi:hypothetical protein
MIEGVLVEAERSEADAILRAMRDVAAAGGTEPLSEADRLAVWAADRYVFRSLTDLDVAGIGAITPAQLATVVGDARLREHAVGFLAVMSLVDALPGAPARPRHGCRRHPTGLVPPHSLIPNRRILQWEVRAHEHVVEGCSGGEWPQRRTK